MGISGKLWFMGDGGSKNDETSIILATPHMVLYPAPVATTHMVCIPLQLVSTLQDRTSSDLDLVWLKVL